jgi:DNA-binding GntR family transcriptional regulator
MSKMVAAIASALEEDLESGRLQPGESLDERGLAERFGVSRTPVRQALQQFVEQGLVQVVPRRGAVVVSVSVPELMMLLDFLAELESICARFACRRITRNQRAELIAAHEEGAAATEADDVHAYARANKRFHGVLYRACANTFVVEQVVRIRRRTNAYAIRRFEQVGRLRESHAEHDAVVRAMLAGDPEACGRAMAVHILEGARGMIEIVAAMPGPETSGSRR